MTSDGMARITIHAGTGQPGDDALHRLRLDH